MDSDLKKHFVNSLMHFKRLGSTFFHGMDVHMGEIAIMNNIAGNNTCTDKSIYVSDIQTNLHISKPAVSQILNNLEKKGYIIREIDSADRRKIAVSLTAKGDEIVKRMQCHSDKILDSIISNFGEDNTKQLTMLLDKLADTINHLKDQITMKGEKDID